MARQLSRPLIGLRHPTLIQGEAYLSAGFFANGKATITSSESERRGLSRSQSQDRTFFGATGLLRAKLIGHARLGWRSEKPPFERGKCT